MYLLGSKSDSNNNPLLFHFLPLMPTLFNMPNNPFFGAQEQNRLNRHSSLARSNALRQPRHTQSKDAAPKSQEEDGGNNLAGPGKPETLDHLKSRIRSLEQENKTLQRDLDLLKLIGPLTPRTLLFHKGQTRIPVASRPSSFDRALSVDEAIDFVKGLDAYPLYARPDRYSIRVCCLCKRGLYFMIPPVNIRVNSLPFILPQTEFSCSGTGTFPCCPESICDDCVISVIVPSIKKDWWHNLGSEHWIRCPHPHCKELLSDQVVSVLVSIPDIFRVSDLAGNLSLFYPVRARRTAIKALDPMPTPEAMIHAAKFNEHLEQHGMLVSRPLECFAAPEVKVFPMDTPDGQTLQVPIFTGVLLQKSALSDTRECVVCADSFRDVTDGTAQSESTWHDTVVSHFPGNWSHLIRPFPPSSALPSCAENHQLNICRSCLSRTIRSQLETRGRAASQSLICPTPECGHMYTHSELRIILDEETFTLYDRQRLNLHLSSEPNFRWCLREGCASGQIYEVVGPGWGLIQGPDLPVASGRSHPNRNRVYCSDCSFVMCFEHQVAWHEGMSCQEYDESRNRNSNSDNDAKTREWIIRNTKPCTCGARVEKRGGCWHMTCRVCGRDFCWECLADWEGNIVRQNPQTGAREYRAGGHRIGCYFRETRAFMPTVVMGDRLEDALTELGFGGIRRQ
ncbi:hypothetical protein QBC43DRAFT_17163 [Cladorrhinum sp. PSN259]|nr:hypothetical protein QBC43DRAFT_17163 [Cladorrhinum sp. PSN259]